MATMTIPPWLVPKGDPVQDYLSAVKLGVSAAEAQAKMAQERDQMQLQAAVRQQSLEQQNRLAQQRLAISQAYNEARMELGRQRMADLERMNTLKIQDAARRYAAQEEYRRRYATGQETPENLLTELGPAMTSSVAGMGPVLSAAQRARPFVPQSMTVDGTKMFQLAPTRWGFEPRAYSGITREDRMADRRRTYLTRRLADLERRYSPTVLGGMPPAMRDKAQSEIEKIRNELEQITPSPESAGGPAEFIWQDGEMVPAGEAEAGSEYLQPVE